MQACFDLFGGSANLTSAGFSVKNCFIKGFLGYNDDESTTWYYKINPYLNYLLRLSNRLTKGVPGSLTVLISGKTIIKSSLS